MDEEEKNLYKSRLSPYVSIDVIKLNEVQYGYKVPRNSTQRTPLVFDFQSFTESQTGKAILGIESCLLNDHLGFIKSLNGIYESDQTSSLPQWSKVKKLQLNMELINLKYPDGLKLLFNGPIKSEQTGYKYITIYTDMSRRNLYLFKLRGLNIEQTTLSNAEFKVPSIFFDQILQIKSDNSNIFLVVDRVHSKLYFFGERSLVSQQNSNIIQEVQLKATYKTIQDCQ